MIVYIKSKSEIDGFTEVGRITNKIMNKLVSNIDVGISTNQLNEIVNDECNKEKVIPTFLNYRGFPASICTSINNVLVHGIPTDYKLKDGDIISVDVGITIDGFIGDMAKTVGVGNISDQDLKLISTCEESLNTSINSAREGNLLSRISESIFKISKKNGFSVPIEYGGHGIDRNKLHADPFIPNFPDYVNNFKLSAGMVLAVEPMFIVGNPQLKVAENKWDVQASSNTAHFEHTILITDDDPIILTGDLNE